MGSGKGDAPEPPDPMATASAQTSMNIGSAIGNQLLGMVNQNTPYGSLNYKQTGSTEWTDPLSGKTYDIPQFSADTQLSPRQMKLYRTQTGAQQNLAELARGQSRRLGSLLGRPMDLSGAPEVTAPQFQQVGSGPEMGRVGAGPKMDMVGKGPNLAESFARGGEITKTYGTDFSKDRRRVEDAIMSRYDQMSDRDRGNMEASLAAKGITPGSEAYNTAMDELNRSNTDARMQAILAGGEEQSRMTGLEASRAAFWNAAQQQGFSQNQALAGFGNTARQQQYLNATGATGINNASRQQMYDNRVGATSFNNNAGQQEFANQMAGAGFNNQWGQQAFGNQRGLRGDYLNEQYALRNQPINEIGALLGTGQVQNPQFVNTPTPQMATTDYAGIVANNFQNQMQAWQAQQQQGGGLLGGLFGLGSSAILGGLGPFGRL